MLTLSGIQKIYRKIKKDISKSYEKKDFGKSILLINSYASIAQCINDVFRDDEIETYISKIAQNAVGIVDKSPHGIPPDGKRIVFYDQIGSTVCLGVQYIQGLLENGYQILYIYEAPSHPINQNLLKILQKEEKIEIILVDSTGNSIKKAKEVRDKIIAFNASKLIIHSPAYGAFGSIVLSCVPFMNRYRIVPGDHHFYIGYKCVDYFLEFRDFGVRLEVEKRALPIESIYKLPYYPLIKLVLPFQGFPEAAQGKITIVAAGAEYKFYGSNVYFDTCLHILTEHENVVILFIGYASPKISQFILANKLENRFIPLGYRKDFGECIKHADLLFNSYPFSGGLVCQYAAYYSLPIISYSDKEHALARQIRGILGGEDQGGPISFYSQEELLDYVNRLIDNSEFRKEEGERMKSMLQTEGAFNLALGKILNDDFPHPKVSSQSIDYDYRTGIYLDNQNNFEFNIINPLLKRYGVLTFYYFPFLFTVVTKQKKYVVNQIFTAMEKYILNNLQSYRSYVLKK